MGGSGAKRGWWRRRRSGRRVGRTRRFAGWVFVGVGVLFTIVWAVSGWFDVYRVWPESGPNSGGGIRLAGVRFGGIEVNRYRYMTLTQGFFAEKRDNAFRNGWFKYDTFNGMGQTEYWIYVPLWPLALGSVAGGALLVRWGMFAHERRAGRCASCGYDLAGLAASAVCPECGEGGSGEAT